MYKEINNVDLLISVINRFAKEGSLEPFFEEDFVKARDKIIESGCYNVVEQDYEQICIKASKKKEGLIIEEKALQLTYDYQTIDFQYFENQIFDYCRNYIAINQPSLSVFDLSNVSEDIISISKQIASYLTDNLISRYLAKQIDVNSYPSQCVEDISEYIFKHDLCKIIKLEGTKENFISVYKNAVKIIAELLTKNEHVEISNCNINALAYSNFYKIIAPFEFIKHFKYSKYRYGTNNKKIIIKVNKLSLNATETFCISSDPYGEWSDNYETKTKQEYSISKHFENIKF